MPSPLLQRFLDSLAITFDKWHDGLGYDLETVREMDATDRQALESLLIDRLQGEGDWRDVEALCALDTPRARQAVLDARSHQQTGVRNYAIGCAQRWEEAPGPEDDEVERAIVESIRSAGAMANLASTLDLAEQHPTAAVKRALLERTLTGDATTRVNCAALVLHLCGQAEEPFDWAQRPFFLRFHTEDGAELQAAWQELKQRTGL